MKKVKISPRNLKGPLVLTLFFGLASVLILSPLFVSADRFEEQINQLQSQNSEKKNQVELLEIEAESLEATINALQAQINALQAQIAASKAKNEDLKVKISEAETELAKQKDLLGKNIKAMYIEGDISTLEILASSKDLSEFVDKQQYRNAVKDKIKGSVDKITALRLELKAQKEEVERLLQEQQTLQAQVSLQQSEQNRLLSLNESQQSAVNQEIKSNHAKITDLRQQQALENIRLFGGGDGVIGGGGYPWGGAKCLQTGQIEGRCSSFEWGYNGSYHNWETGGYAFRNCTDWVAYRITALKGYGPGGLGNAKTWDGRAPAYGYRVLSSISAADWRPGIAVVSNSGFYGHVMYLEAVSEDGRITVSDYNRAGTGKYAINEISPAGLTFVFF